MKQFLILIFPILSYALCSCGNSVQKNNEIKKTVDTKTNIDEPKKENAKNTILPSKDFTEIEFDHISLLFHRLKDITQDIDSYPEKVKDTLAFYYDLTETVLGQDIFVKSSNLTDLSIEFSYETSLGIHFDGEHFDFLDWKHYTSKWKKLLAINGKYSIPDLSNKEQSKFPSYTIKELEEKSIQDSLTGVYTQKEGLKIVGISRIFFRIVGYIKGEKHSYLVIFHEPMGC